MTLRADKKMFTKDGKPHFVLSGEIHYFRLRPEKWEEHLELLKETGANTTSTYIPWDWHEYEEGRFDFTGETDPARNLVGYINLCKKTGLDLIIKPGPYILAEYENQGLPEWLVEKCGKDAFVHDENGRIQASDIMCYMSEEFLSYVFKWYDRVMQIIADNQASAGGPIVMMQVCNEVGVFQWLSGQMDYNNSVIKLYNDYILEKYHNIEDLNEVYGTSYTSFEQAEPPKGIIRNRQDYCAYYDFHLFFRHYYVMYFDTLINRIRSYGIDLQLTHNVPGWIYGNASELPMLISTYSEIMKTRNDVTFGLDHIPEFVSFRNAHSDLACNKILEAMQTCGPAWAAEFQAGTREHHVKNYAFEMRTFYYMALAHGMKSFNYYMFSQGKNPPGKGYFGKTFYYQTAVDYNAEKQPLYDVIKEVGEFINAEKYNLLLSKVKADICVGLYKPYFYTELTSSQMLKNKRLLVENTGMYLDPRFIREEVLFNGLLRALQTLNFSYDIIDLENSMLEKALEYKQLWVTAAEYMDPDTQDFLALYAQNGGHLVIYPVIPELDNYLKPCKVISDRFRIKSETKVSPNKVDVLGIKDTYSFFQKKQVFTVSDNEEAIAWTRTGDICGIRKKIGKGKATILGFAFGYTAEEHLELVGKIVSSDDIKKEVDISDPEIQYVLRQGPLYSYLFLANCHNEEKSFTIGENHYVMAPFSCAIEKLFTT